MQYGAFEYGTALYGGSPRVIASAAITSATTVVAAGAFVINGGAAITSSNSVTASSDVLADGAAAITPVQPWLWLITQAVERY